VCAFLVFGFVFQALTVSNGTHLEKEEVVGQALLVVGKGHREDIKDGLFVDIELNLGLVGDLNKDVEMGMQRVEDCGVKGVVALCVFIVTVVVDVFVSCAGR
jgi:hypothetical protein